MEKWAGKIADALVSNELIAEEKREDYAYVLQCMMETAVSAGSILAVSILLGKVFQSIVFMIYFFALRKRTGGYHLSTFQGCYVGSLALYILVVLLGETAGGQGIWLALAVLAASVVVMVCGTVNHPNLDLSLEEQRKMTKSARRVLVIELAFLLIMRLLGIQLEVIAYGCLGIILCALLCLLAKITGQEVKKDEERSITACGEAGKGSCRRGE